MAFCPEHPKWDQNPKFNYTPKRDDEHPRPFHMGVLPGGYFQFTWRKKTNWQLETVHWQIPWSPPSERGRCYTAPSFELASLYLAYGPYQKLIFVCVFFKHPGTIKQSASFIADLPRDFNLAFSCEERKNPTLHALYLYKFFSLRFLSCHAPLFFPLFSLASLTFL